MACITEEGAAYMAWPKPENWTGASVVKACGALGGRVPRIPGATPGCVGAESWIGQACTTPVQGGVEVLLL
jgi:hypothetical protein